MNLKITFPEDFPLHGLERDMFETKLRAALRFCFHGNTVRQLAERVDARRARSLPAGAWDALPLRRIADEHAFDDCLTLDGCRIEDMSTSLRRNLLRNVGARIGLTISEWGDSALPLPGEPVSHVAGHVMESDATNSQFSAFIPVRGRHAPRTFSVLLAAGLCVAVAIGGAAWKSTRPAAPLSATVVSTSPAQTLRDLASSVPDDRRPYRVSVQIEPQGGAVTHR
ncbi:hypothetical protein B0G76_8608 [Paraburkholderia sp. BL23I1N1]|uniref:hypothetical protein n=1 Tax=Paraburkholderia sp. BL23I1N1 TaxID=1938802 RepID=UPI000E731A3F|nr:hypothetical protein [Paraburkholderia sp. BL23I1N1]RKE23908.1 hypothetical protein B0G76_8608 [Paraburkholderia sp. BL23I1N1]